MYRYIFTANMEQVDSTYQFLQKEAARFGARCIAVSKTHPPERILEVYAQGQRLFGENRVQELVPKYQALPKDIAWHFIGSLQTNKVKYIAPFVAMIHSVDSEKLLLEIEKQAKQNGRVIPVLLQFHIAQEETKHGMMLSEAIELLKRRPPHSLEHVAIVGVMGMASFTDHQEQIRAEFRQLLHIKKVLKEQFFTDNPDFKEVSMGMSADWQIALEEGSTLLRIGSLVFGTR